MKEQIFLCLLLMAASLLCGCSEQRYAPDSIPSYAEITTESETAPIQSETTLSEPEPQEKGLAMIVNGMVLDVRGRIMKQLQNCLPMPKTKQSQ